ncbi:hypothetical protein Chor_005584 [Crotalus horridus]
MFPFQMWTSAKLTTGAASTDVSTPRGAITASARRAFVSTRTDGRVSVSLVGFGASPAMHCGKIPWTDGASSNPCAINNGGCEHDCVQLSFSQHRCQCRPNYQLKEDGRHCVVRNPCAPQNGACMHKCHNHNGVARCECHPGYRLGPDRKTCQGIEMEIVNSCETNNGGCSHLCHHTSAGPACSCNFGYSLDEDQKTCVDTDECSVGTHCCQQGCYNYPGGYECVCYAGYQLNPAGCSCDDLDECSANNGGCEHFCRNLAGSFLCSCRIGFKLGEDRRSCLSLEEPTEAVDGRRPVIRPLPHVALFQEELSRVFEEDYEDEEGEGAEARGEHTISETFICLDDTFGPNCSLSCERCQNGGRCNQHRTSCICADGWRGLLCNETCPKGTFGKDCSSACPCQNGGSCHPVTGACRCPPRSQWGPLRRRGFFGKNCGKKCQCANRGRCHRVFGNCLCDPGRYGRFCHLACPKWAYGTGCSEECHCVQANTQHCDKRDGACVCKPGYQGDKCQAMCDPGRFGPGCRHKCGCPSGVACDHVGEECPQQCPEGYYGEKCQQECPEGKFGVNCLHSCSCNGSPCSRSTGECRCVTGKTGKSCEQECPEGHWGDGCQQLCPECENNGRCDPITGACFLPTGLVLGKDANSSVTVTTKGIAMPKQGSVAVPLDGPAIAAKEVFQATEVTGKTHVVDIVET